MLYRPVLALRVTCGAPAVAKACSCRPLLVTVLDWPVCLVQFWKAVQQVTDMVQNRQQPDRFTYAAVLWACHRCGEAALACEIYR